MRIGFMGDSITDYDSAPATTAWPYRLALRLEPVSPPWGAPTVTSWQSGGITYYTLSGYSHTLVDAAHGGEGTTAMLARFDADLLSRLTAGDYCFIDAGTNDGNTAEAFANLTAMVDKCTTAGVIPILCTLTARSDDEVRALRPPALNALIVPYCAENGVRIQDFYAVIGEAQIATLLDVDRLHPIAAGYQALADSVDISDFSPLATPGGRCAVIAPHNPVIHLEATPIDSVSGGLYDKVSRAWATVARAGTRTMLQDGSLVTVPANLLGCRRRTDGKRGYEAFISEARTNLYLQTTFADATALATWTADAGGTATLGGASLHAASNEVTLAADASARALWRTLTATAAARSVSWYVRKSDGSAVSATDCQLAAVAATTTPVGTLLTTTFTAVPNSVLGYYRATATYTGTVATWASGIVAKAGKTVIVACPQDELGAFATAYAPNVATAVARAWDNTTFPSTGMSKDAGTIIVVAGQTDYASGSNSATLISDGAFAANGFALYDIATVLALRVWDAANGSRLNAADHSAPPAGEYHTYTGTWTAGTLAAYLDSAAAGTSSGAGTGILGALGATLIIGSRASGVWAWNNAVQSVVIYDKVLTDAQKAEAVAFLKDGPRQSAAPNLLLLMGG